jgi:hypothetical protein
MENRAFRYPALLSMGLIMVTICSAPSPQAATITH